jgi:hypothetical protein
LPVACGNQNIEMDVRDYENVELLLDAIFSDCCFGRSQRRISDKTAHTSTFDFGGLIDQFAFIVGEVNESFFSKAWCGSPTRCGGLFLRHNQMVSPNSGPSSYSTCPMCKGQPNEHRELLNYRIREQGDHIIKLPFDFLK